MKQESTLNWLIPLIALLAVLVAGFGLFLKGGNGPFTFTTVYGNIVEIYGRGIYQHDSAFVATLSRGTDFVSLFVSLPMLLIGYWLYLPHRNTPVFPVHRCYIYLLGGLQFIVFDLRAAVFCQLVRCTGRVHNI